MLPAFEMDTEGTFCCVRAVRLWPIREKGRIISFVDARYTYRSLENNCAPNILF